MPLLYETAKGNYDVVDGQQRLTSLLILASCLRDLLESEDHKGALQDKILQKKNVVDGIPEKVRLEVRDWQIFNDIVVESGGTLVPRSPKDLPEPDGRYALAVDIFKSKLDSLSQNELQEITQFLSQKCVLIYLATSGFDDAFGLFTIVNDRGKQLGRIDVLKALNLAPAANASDAVRKRIAQDWETREKDLGESTFESVFHLVRLILLKDKPQGDLLKEFQSRVFDKKLVSLGEPFVNLIFDYADLYASIFMDRDFLPDGDEKENWFKSLMFIMDSEFRASDWRACVLSFAKKFGSEGFYDMVLAMERLYLNNWVQSVRKDERYAEYARKLSQA